MGAASSWLRKPTSYPTTRRPRTGRLRFNGNKLRRGRGYRLLTEGGWLAKAGYPLSDIREFLADLGELSRHLGLVPVAIHPTDQRCYSLDELQNLPLRPANVLLDRVHLRVYSAADYVDRWNAFFVWQAPTALTVAREASLNEVLVKALKQNKLSRQAFARELEIDPSLLSKLLNGKKPWPARLRLRVEDWLAGRTPDSHVAANRAGCTDTKMFDSTESHVADSSEFMLGPAKNSTA